MVVVAAQATSAAGLSSRTEPAQRSRLSRFDRLHRPRATLSLVRAIRPNLYRRQPRSVAGKGHKADAAAAMSLHEIQYREAGATEAVGPDIGCQHAFGAIDGEEDVEAVAVFLLPGVEQVRAGEGD